MEQTANQQKVENVSSENCREQSDVIISVHLSLLELISTAAAATVSGWILPSVGYRPNGGGGP